MPSWPHLTHCNLFACVFNVLYVPAYSQCVSNILSAICLAFTLYICVNRCVWRFCLVSRYADYSSCSCSRFSIYLSVVHMYVCACRIRASFISLGPTLRFHQVRMAHFSRFVGFLWFLTCLQVYSDHFQHSTCGYMCLTSAWLLSLTCVCDSVL